MTQLTPAFRYKPNYVAAWPDAASEAMLQAHGVRRRVHLTTFFDGYGQMASVKPFPWDGAKQARIAAVVEWTVGDVVHLIAEMADCSWSQAVNEHYRAQGVREDLPHRPHVTLDKRVARGTAAQFQALVGQVITFDRHGGEIDDRPPFMVEGDLVLRDWKVEQVDRDRILVTTPPMGSALRERHMAHRDECEGFYMLARAMLGAPRALGARDANQLVEAVTMSLLGKSVDPAPGVNWQCNRQWTVDEVRQAVRSALDTAGVTLLDLPVHADVPSMVSQLLD